ncbi:hypothetical protein [Flavobacterium sp.]|uniref:hypothetical protein n=1 Tax=Flavobacterium sp. TaxID=239 RepID=UPI00286B2648|nr:hypothetical protein [Flavobacterium sp.]
MNHFSKQNDTKKFTTIFIVMAFIVLSNMTAFGQTVSEKNTDQNATSLKNEIVNNTVEINTTKQQNATTDSNMNFVLWFMGSKQDPNTTISSEATSTKNKVRTSGIAPNRLLIKAFLKKATNFETTIV